MNGIPMRKFRKTERDWIQQLELMRQLFHVEPDTKNVSIETESIVDEKEVKDEVR